MKIAYLFWSSKRWHEKNPETHFTSHFLYDSSVHLIHSEPLFFPVCTKICRHTRFHTPNEKCSVKHNLVSFHYPITSLYQGCQIVSENTVFFANAVFRKKSASAHLLDLYMCVLLLSIFLVFFSLSCVEVTLTFGTERRPILLHTYFSLNMLWMFLPCAPHNTQNMPVKPQLSEVWGHCLWERSPGLIKWVTNCW